MSRHPGDELLQGRSGRSPVGLRDGGGRRLLDNLETQVRRLLRHRPAQGGHLIAASGIRSQ